VEPFAVGYTRLLFRSDYSWNLWRNWTWYFSFRSGIERNTQDITDVRVAIPLIKQFALGGAASLRGFREQELNIQDIAVRGTASYVNYRTQLDIPISGPLRVGPFLDAANLLVDRFSFKEGLRLGTGLGLHYLTPVGPINFDLGFKVDPRPDEEAYRFYFSIGMI
jgi:outer membrane translocation and assembly module TamA